MITTKDIKGFIFATNAPIVFLFLYQLIIFFLSIISNGPIDAYFWFLMPITIVVYGVAIVLGIPFIFILKFFCIKRLFWHILFGIILGVSLMIFLFIPDILSYTYKEFIIKICTLHKIFSIGGLMGAMSGFCYWYIAVSEDYSDCS